MIEPKLEFGRLGGENRGAAKFAKGHQNGLPDRIATVVDTEPTKPDPTKIERRRDLPAPMSRLGAIKCIAGGAICTIIAVLLLHAPAIPIYIFAILVLGGPVAIWLGIVELFHPQWHNLVSD